MDVTDSVIVPERFSLQKNNNYSQRNGFTTTDRPILKAESKSKMVSITTNLEQSTQTPKSLNVDNVKQVAKELAVDIVNYVSGHKHSKPVNQHAITLRRTVDELSEKHEIVFNSIVKKLQPLTRDTAVQTFFNVMDEMFRDCSYNWGRVVSVYAFGGRLAKHFVDIKATDFVEKVAECLGTFVAEKLSKWIHQQGGWDAFDAYFPERSSMETVIWKSLVMTAFGLGALATMVAVR
uniref:Bcl-xL protein n=1 Tax=Urechis unicinctus TaxID=6432 RepID=A0A144KBE2_UREUN|nr:Bcl-xL protein [Urechis unicinctus]